jgi:hypothetical protein
MVLPSSPATARATISELPPVANGTTKRKGLEGQADWACDWGSHNPAAEAVPAARKSRRLKCGDFMTCLLFVLKMRCVIVPHPSSQFAFNADFLSPSCYRHNLAMRILLAEDEHALA